MPEVIEKTTMNVTPMTNILVVITDNPMKPLQSLYELIDNSIDSFKRSKIMGAEIKNPLIDIRIPSIAEIKSDTGKLIVRDNAVGLTYEETNGAVTAGYSGKNKYDTLGLFGMGFNIATGKLGVETHFITTKADDDYAIDVKINLKEMTKSNSYDIPCEKIEKEEGFVTGTIVEISQWWEKGNSKRTHIEKLASMSDKSICDAIGRVYATILRENKIKIFVNGKKCEAYEPCCWSENRFVETKKYGKIYAKYYVDEVLHSERRCITCGTLLGESDTVCPECDGNKVRTIEERVYGWVGIQRYLDRQDFGVDLIRNGRAICIGEKDAFFTWEDETGRKNPEYPQENEGRGRIIGELHFDHVPVDYTKTDFVRTTPQWTRAISFIRGDASLLPRKQGDVPNDSVMFKLYQGYHQMSVPGKKSLYIGYWSESQNKPVTFDKAKMDEYIQGFKEKRPGYYKEEDWWAQVEAADQKPVDNLENCPKCGTQIFNDSEVCDICGYILKGKTCINPECGKIIRASQTICEHCGQSQIIEIDKEWRCEICGTKNSPMTDTCKKCGEKIGSRLHLSEEYLMDISEEQPQYSIDNCSVQLADGKYTENYKVTTYVTQNRIVPNKSNVNLPYYAVSNMQGKKLFIDLKHPLFAMYDGKPEYVIAYEAAIAIYDNYPSLSVTYKEHTIASIMWSVINTYFKEALLNDESALRNNMHSLITAIYEKLASSVNENVQEEIDNEIVQNAVKNILSSNQGDKLGTIFSDGSFIRFLDADQIGKLFESRPEMFFDGVVFGDAYSDIEGVSPEIKYDMQKKLCSKYGNYLNSMVDYLGSKQVISEETEYAKLSYEILKKKVMSDVC